MRASISPKIKKSQANTTRPFFTKNQSKTPFGGSKKNNLFFDPANKLQKQAAEQNEPDYNESVLIWLNAFIPGTVPGGTKTISQGEFAGDTCIPAPGPFGCALTDNRSFSNDKLAKTRMRLFILVNLKDLTFEYGGFSDYTHHIDTDDGSLLCKKRSKGTYVADGKIMGDNPNGLGMKFMAFGSNPCVPFSPDIDLLGMLAIDRKARKIKVQALLDEFPAFEMYALSTKTHNTKTIFTKDPYCNNSSNVMCLFGGASVNAEGDINF